METEKNTSREAKSKEYSRRLAEAAADLDAVLDELWEEYGVGIDAHAIDLALKAAAAYDEQCKLHETQSEEQTTAAGNRAAFRKYYRPLCTAVVAADYYIAKLEEEQGIKIEKANIDPALAALKAYDEKYPEG